MIDSAATLKRTACTRDCGDACSMIATVQNGRVTHLQGDPDHPVTQGFLCHRTSRFLERQYDPSRLTTPLIRRDGQLQPATWDEALGRIAETMLQIRDESGPEAILHYRCGGSLGIFKLLGSYFFQKFGPVTVQAGDICTGAGDAAQRTDFGECDSHDLFDLLNSKTIVLWGRNPYVSQVHLLPVLKQAKKNGAKLTLIDPVWHQTANLCDLYLQPRPGSDAAVAFAATRRLFETGQFDQSAIDYCDNFDEFRSLVFSKSAAEWAESADLRAEEIDALASLYADGPSAIIVGWGLQRRANGSATVRAIDALGAVSGNLGIAGGGVSYYFNRRAGFDLSFMQSDRKPRSIPEALLGQGILAASDPPIRMVWIDAANPVVMLPESKSVEQALKSRELTVVVDSFLTDTAQCADIVLPTTTMLEEDDLVGAYAHHWVASVNPVVDAPDGVKSDLDILNCLAPLVGLAPEFSLSTTDWKRRLLKPESVGGVSLEALDAGAVRVPAAPAVLFADRKFKTPTGRVNLTQALPAMLDKLAPGRLFLTAQSIAQTQGSQWLTGQQDGWLTATIHPDSASGLNDGDIAVIEAGAGQLTVRLKFDGRQRRDILLVPKGGWLSRHRCANTLIKARQTDAGGGAVYLDTVISLRRA
jgi:anaerobic selenocysteine-containing dehydrogenase